MVITTIAGYFTKPAMDKAIMIMQLTIRHSLLIRAKTTNVPVCAKIQVCYTVLTILCTHRVVTM